MVILNDRQIGDGWMDDISIISSYVYLSRINACGSIVFTRAHSGRRVVG